MPGAATAFIAAVCYALSYIFVRKGQTESDAGDHGLLPVLAVSTLTLSIALLIKIMTNPSPLVLGTKQELAILFCILAGVVGTCFGRMALYAAIARIGATRGVIIDMLSALVTLMVAIAFLGEKFRWSSVYGMSGIVLGLLLLIAERVWFPSRLIQMVFRSGMAMSVAAAFLQGVGHVFRKPSILSPVSPTFAATVDMASALLLYILLLLLTGKFKRYATQYATELNLYFIAAGCLSAAGVLLFFSASTTIPVSQVSMIISIQPVIIALMSGVLLSKLEYITRFTIASAVLVTLGVIAISI